MIGRQFILKSITLKICVDFFQARILNSQTRYPSKFEFQTTSNTPSNLDCWQQERQTLYKPEFSETTQFYYLNLMCD